MDGKQHTPSLYILFNSNGNVVKHFSFGEFHSKARSVYIHFWLACNKCVDAHNTFTDVKFLEHSENDLSIHRIGGFGSGLVQGCCISPERYLLRLLRPLFDQNFDSWSSKLSGCSLFSSRHLSPKSTCTASPRSAHHAPRTPPC